MRFCMDWRNLNFDWNRARAFLVTAEEGSFSAAARALRSTQPTVGRQVSALEDELGVTLFERTSAGLVLTQSGLELLEHVRVMGAAALQTSFAAAGQSRAVEGNVSITASEAIACFLLPPIVERLRREYPGITLELVVSNQVSDLHRREADIALRNFAPTQPDLIARKVRDSAAHLYAAQSYVDRVGPLETRDDLPRAEFFAFEDSARMVKQIQGALGVELTREQFVVETSNHLVMWEMCKQGAGVCFMMEEIGSREPSVVKVFSALGSIPVPIWMVCHRELRTSLRLRLVFDFLARELSGEADRARATGPTSVEGG